MATRTRRGSSWTSTQSWRTCSSQGSVRTTTWKACGRRRRSDERAWEATELCRIPTNRDVKGRGGAASNHHWARLGPRWCYLMREAVGVDYRPPGLACPDHVGARSEV